MEPIRMTARDRIFIDLIDQYYVGKKWFLPRFLLRRMYDFVCRVFQEEAIASYLADRQDIGFFENFLLGAEESKKVSEVIEDSIRDDLRGTAMKRSVGSYQTIEERQRDKNELMLERIAEKKELVVELLRSKGEVIRYLGRRIVTQNEKLYEKLERIYNQLSSEVQDMHGKNLR